LGSSSPNLETFCAERAERGPNAEPVVRRRRTMTTSLATLIARRLVASQRCLQHKLLNFAEWRPWHFIDEVPTERHP